MNVNVTGLFAYGGFVRVKFFSVRNVGDEVVESVKSPKRRVPSLVVTSVG